MKLALLHSFEESSWVSCQSITSNLIEAYKRTDAEVATYKYGAGTHRIKQFVLELFEKKPDVLVFLDHDINRFSIIREIVKYKKDWKPALIFHTFGDFVLNSVHWREVEECIIGYKCKFISSSDKQSSLISKFVEGDSLNGIVPFPVDENSFFFSEEQRLEKRNELGIGKDELVYLYTGRFSLQKNVLELINIFSKFNKLTDRKVKLLLAGEFDDLGLPYLGLTLPEGSYLSSVMKAYLELEESIKKNIIFLGDLDKEELSKTYNASDLFISLSTHNDEDYGMSPAEALCTGLPVVLTEWGGYYSFLNKYSQDSFKIKTKVGEDRVIPNSVSALKAFIQSLDIDTSSEERLKREKYARKFLSVESVSETIKLKPSAEFKGYSDTFKKVSNLFKANKYAPFRGAGMKFNNFYFEVYQTYME